MRKQAARWLIATLGVALALSGQAAEFGLAAGASATAGLRWAPAVFAEAAGTPADDGHAHLVPLASVGAVGSRNTDHENLDHTVFLLAGGLRYGRANGLFVSEQIAGTSTRTDALSSRFEFMTSLGFHDGRWMVLLRHVSNAHIIGGGRNLGETMVLVGVRFRANG